jgi:thiol:disulfide interchange protein DsbC
MTCIHTVATLICALVFSPLASAQEDVIRKNLPIRLPQFKQIDEVRKSEVPGLYEVRVDGTEIYYTDAKGDFLIEGSLIDTRNKRNLTEERVEKLTAIKFESLPLKDAFTVVRGNGERKMAVFEDPNCGYCKRFERDLQKVDNVTIYMFLYPILGADSVEKSKAIWCAKDRGTAWLDWMLREQLAGSASGGCDATALSRNVELGRKYKINGTPTMLFTNGSRVPGAVDNKKVEQLLAQAGKS